MLWRVTVVDVDTGLLWFPRPDLQSLNAPGDWMGPLVVELDAVGYGYDLSPHRSLNDLVFKAQSWIIHTTLFTM